MKSIGYIDSHTGGEPTRLIPELPFPVHKASVAEQLTFLQAHHDTLRTTILHEPRGSDVLVGAYLVEPAQEDCQFGVIFFNNVGYLGMCGHGLIGVIATLSFLGRIQPGTVRVETPVGVVEATLHPTADGYPNRVSIKNVPAFRFLSRIQLEIGRKTIHGDVAWGGNWFFLVYDHGLAVDADNLKQLTAFCSGIRNQLAVRGIRGKNGEEIDHIELFGPSREADSRSFVLCPGNAYDRSPCGTGTSAKLACLYADGELAIGQVWRQQSIIGSIFDGYIEQRGGQLIPTITGEAWIMARGELVIDPRDPFGQGFSGTSG
jgi:4-hydroxyproline epimerase